MNSGRSKGEAALPVLGRLAGGVQHEASDGDDQAALLGEADELAGHHQPALRVVPAHQRLQPHHVAAGQLEHRLVADGELLLQHRLAQRCLEVQPLHRPVAHRRVERPHRAGAGRLGGVHRQVGVAQQLVGVAASGDRPHAHAGPGVHLPAGHLDRLAQVGGQPLGHRQRLPFAADPVQQHRELVPAEPRGGVALPQPCPQPLGHRLQDPVAGRVAEAVVDGPEVVEVQQQQRGGGAAGHHLLEPLLEPGPVGQAGERVDAVPPGQLRGEAGAVQCQCHLGAEAVERLPRLGRDRPPPAHQHSAPAAVRGRQRRGGLK
jgi:hypothetical protein